MTRNSQIAIPAPVPAGTVAGDVVAIGADGLTGWVLTDRVTQADIDNLNKNTPQGLKDGEASIELIGIHTAIRRTVAVAVALGARIFRAADGTYNTTNTGTPVGFALADAAAGATVAIGLARA